MGSFPETEIGHSSDLTGYQIDNKVLFIYSHIPNRNNVKMLDRHLFPSAKLTFSSQWLSQDISLFLHEISLSREISIHKSLSLFNF